MLFRWIRGTFNRKPSRSERTSKLSRIRAKTYRPKVEYLEDRFLLSINVGPNVNISREAGNQNEATIAINPLFPNQIFVASNDEASPIGFGLLAGFSNDGGKTWVRELVGGITGNGTVPPACCDPQAMYDQFGNLYLLYLDGAGGGADLLLSTDNGLTFSTLILIPTAFDQPQIAVGPNSVWLAFSDGIGFDVTGAKVTGLGAANIGTFGIPEELAGSDGANFGSIAVGPSGQVTAVYQNALIGATTNEIRANVNLTGIGGTWSQSIIVTGTNVLNTDKSIPANSNDQGTSAQPELKYDLSSGAFAGRLYLVYSDAPSNTSSDVGVFIRFSDDSGVDWTGPIRVNDFDNGVASHFLPSIVVDPVTGIVAAQWYDTRNDLGNHGPGDTNGIPNDDAQLFVSASFDGGVHWAPNVRVSAGTSNAAASEPPVVGLRPLGFGDYIHANAFFNGALYPVWADNSNFTRDNPDGTLMKMDMYTAQVLISSAPSPTPISLVLGPTAPSSTTGGPINIVLGPGGGTSGANSFANSLRGSLGSGTRTADALTGNFSGNGTADLAGFDPQTGQWWVSVTNGTTSVWANWSPAVHWTNVMVGDFNGDGKADIIGREPTTGNWWLGLSTGTSFVTSYWGTWNPRVTWADVKVGDFTGDGKDDIIGRVLQTGQWWVGKSTGSSLANSLWATWSTAVTWVDMKVADFNHDGKADITARALELGQWWTGLSTGQGFATSLWAQWNPSVTWVDVKVGDFNGDGFPDIVGRVLQTGQWWVGTNTGSGFSASLWATWSTAVTWVDVQVGDFNGDGRSDITGRVQQTGQWWTATSTGSTFSSSLWGAWNAGVTWVDVQQANLNGNALIGMDQGSGLWWMATPTVSITAPVNQPSTTLGPSSTTTPTTTPGPISSVLGPH
jgi:hypothetical protein